MPMPAHCIDCDKVATVFVESVPYCSVCGLKEVKSKKKVSKRNI